MQQTDKYKLNLVEKDDVFSPDPLNENTEKVEAALSNFHAALESKSSTTDAAVSELDQRVTALELKKVVVGHYVGTGGRKPIALGFTPIAVLLHGNGDTALAVTGYITGGAEITETGFMAREDGTQNLNTQSRQYNYIAFG